MGGVSIGGVSVGADIEINDDEAERRKRYTACTGLPSHFEHHPDTKLTAGHALSKPNSRRNRKSFGAPLARPQGAAGGATNAQISQMYTTAIKLSTQNVRRLHSGQLVLFVARTH